VKGAAHLLHPRVDPRRSHANLIYAGSNAPEHDREAKRRGASGSTGNPRDLFQRAVAILTQG